jgi:CBS domain-containing protein
MGQSEFEDSYEDDEKRVRGAILTEPIESLELRPPVSVPYHTTLKKVVEVLQEHHIGCVLVVGADGKLEGIFTERDLLNRVAGRPVDLGQLKVADYMTKNPGTLQPHHKIAWALNKMHVGGFRHVPITDGKGHPVGLLSVKDIVAFIVDLFPDAVLNLPDDPSAEAHEMDGG